MDDLPIATAAQIFEENEHMLRGTADSHGKHTGEY